MNYSTAIFLINDDVRALYVIYQADGNDVRRYMVKTFDKDIKKGDYVIVPSTIGFAKLTIAEVTDVDVEVDFDATTMIPWVVQRIDFREFTETVEQENAAVSEIKKAHFVSKRKKLVEDMMDAKTMRSLPLATPRNRSVFD